MDQDLATVKGGARSLPPDALERLRRRVVAAVESGVSQSHVARTFGVSRKTVGTWVRAYQVNGEQALRPRRRGRRTGEKLALSAAQQAWLLKIIAGSPPDEVDLPYLVWTRRAIAELIRREFAIRLSPATIDHYLSRWGVVTKSTKQQGASALEQAHRDVLRVVSTRPDPSAGQGWLHALVAVTSSGVLLFLLSERPFGAGRIADFHQRLRVQLGREVRLVLRECPAGRSPLPDHWRTGEPDITAY